MNTCQVQSQVCHQRIRFQVRQTWCIVAKQAESASIVVPPQPLSGDGMGPGTICVMHAGFTTRWMEPTGHLWSLKTAEWAQAAGKDSAATTAWHRQQHSGGEPLREGLSAMHVDYTRNYTIHPDRWQWKRRWFKLEIGRWTRRWSLRMRL